MKSSITVVLSRKLADWSPQHLPVFVQVSPLRHDSNELDSSSSTERSSPVMLSTCATLSVNSAKHLSAPRDRPFPALRVTRCDCSNCQVRFTQIEPCLSYIFYAPRGKAPGSIY